MHPYVSMCYDTNEPLFDCVSFIKTITNVKLLSRNCMVYFEPLALPKKLSAKFQSSKCYIIKLKKIVTF